MLHTLPRPFNSHASECLQFSAWGMVLFVASLCAAKSMGQDLEVVVEVETRLLRNDEVRLFGKTNLPAGTRVMLLMRPESWREGDSMNFVGVGIAAVDESGQFQARLKRDYFVGSRRVAHQEDSREVRQENYRAMLGPQVITAKIPINSTGAFPFAHSPERQPQEVFDVIGPFGERLRGPLVFRSSSVFGKAIWVEHSEEFEAHSERFDRQAQREQVKLRNLQEALDALEAALAQATRNGSVRDHEFYVRWQAASDHIRDQYRFFQVAQPILWIDQSLADLESRRWYEAVAKQLDDTPDQMREYLAQFAQAEKRYAENRRLLKKWLDDLRD